MACDCDNYINCGDPTTEVPAVANTSNAYAHSYVNNTLTDDVLKFLIKVNRSFSASYSGYSGLDIQYVVKCDDLLDCGSAVGSRSSHCSESCSIEVNVPYYWDRYRDIYVWKNIKETLAFDITSSKTAAFKMKFGYGTFYKICIPNTVKTAGTEQFIMQRNGVQTVLAKSEYTYNPFPATEGGGATWGLYGNTITRSGSPDTADVACILVFPTVPKQAIPLDPDVIYYGFYDYNAIDGGFVETSLPKDDGGKDYFYPYWCRNMPSDAVWRETADARYEAIFNQNINLAGTNSWTPPNPRTYPWPFGSFALDSKENFVASCILQFGEHTGNNGIIYNYASMGDLFDALKKTTVPFTKKFSSVYPVVPK